ncbi:hypothetical protein [Janthinobacterium sp. SUN033]|uniref:hypothetical protein n=1 Tax=Janthinobacterium sp. SUN033 TaxID=3002439 RepID=UPI0025B22DAD|nr:hypothetical protein [Janthinobacterium sp. SUN033]MDN2676530.1 hypothetical protein [Janthinobacterium sp. SUN033]
MTTVSEILATINKSIFFETIFQKDTDWDAALCARDSFEFDGAWCASYEKVSSSCPPEGALVREIREIAFKKVYQVTENSDLAGYVSDDMGLIAQACHDKVEIDFIDNLWKTYMHGEFPT